MFTEEQVIQLFIAFQDRVVAGLKLRQQQAKDYLQADAYEQAARIVMATPLAPKDP